MYTPEELLQFTPKPSYIQFQYLPSHENYFACLFLEFLLWHANPNQKKLPQQTRST
jgi:hypothetical protein